MKHHFIRNDIDVPDKLHRFIILGKLITMHQTYQSFLWTKGSYESGVAAVSGKLHKRRRWGVYTSGAAVSVDVCTPQMGVNIRQSSGLGQV